MSLSLDLDLDVDADLALGWPPMRAADSSKPFSRRRPRRVLPAPMRIRRQSAAPSGSPAPAPAQVSLLEHLTTLGMLVQSTGGRLRRRRGSFAGWPAECWSDWRMGWRGDWLDGWCTAEVKRAGAASGAAFAFARVGTRAECAWPRRTRVHLALSPAPALALALALAPDPHVSGRHPRPPAATQETLQ